jgi:hypothetical protein
MTAQEETAAKEFSPLGWKHWQEQVLPLLKRKVVKYEGVELKLIPPKSAQHERDAMLGYALRRESAEVLIYREATGLNAAVAAVLASIDVSTDRPVNLKLKQLREDLIQEVKAPCQALKLHFGRPRPWMQYGGALMPLLMPPHWRYPGSPTYPGGHATMAWVVAYLFGKCATPAQKSKLEAAATQVALNRVIAGVHYPSDSEAGKQLAAQLVEVMLTKKPALVAGVNAFMKTLPPN